MLYSRNKSASSSRFDWLVLEFSAFWIVWNTFDNLHVYLCAVIGGLKKLQDLQKVLDFAVIEAFFFCPVTSFLAQIKLYMKLFETPHAP